MVTREKLKRGINISIIFLVIAAVLFSIFSYIAISTEINVVKDAANMVGRILTEPSNSINRIISSANKINAIFLLETFIFGAGVVLSLISIFYLVKIYFKARKTSLIDDLTEIYNKRALYKILDKEVKRAKRFNHPLTIVMIDIDFFKVYNDKNGHVAGDNLLKKIAKIFSKNIRDVDTVARYGGEEFVIILPETKHQEAADVAERIRKEVENTPFKGEKTQPKGKITISMGMATFKGGYKVKTKMLESADKLLYKAKSEGRNQLIKAYIGAEK